MKNLIIGTESKLSHDVMGLFAFVNNMSSAIWFNKNSEEDINFFYDIVENSPYYDPTIKETNNVWEYYFEPPSGIKYSEINKNLETIRGTWSSFNGGNNILNMFQTKEISDEQKIKINEIHNAIFNGKNKIKLKSDVYDLIQKTKKTLGLENTKYISVHYRSFIFEKNKIYNPHQSKKIELENWFNEIDKVLTSDHKIFLATDNEIVLNNFIIKYGDKLIFNKNVERIKDEDIEYVGDNPFNFPKELLWVYNSLAQSPKRKQSPYESGLYAIIDCWLLSGGQYIIKHFSGLSFFSTLINPNIKIINIDKIY